MIQGEISQLRLVSSDGHLIWELQLRAYIVGPALSPNEVACNSLPWDNHMILFCRVWGFGAADAPLPAVQVGAR